VENFKDPSHYPPAFEGSFFKGTGRTVANEIYFNNAQKPLIDAPSGIFSMSESGIATCIDSLNKIGIKATRQMFDSTLVSEI
jgi:hypothetical protein